ncbi:hypothetical protein KR059_003323 [Drosophila kikkawai]|nr:hypothetical protein KR059_003323 [Drosophila kikkawai]
MHLKNFLCCVPLEWGVMFLGLTYGITYFILGTTGLQMVFEGKYHEYLIWFFRKMPINSCVAVGSIVLYFMGFINLLLAYGAHSNNDILVGIWLLVHFMLFMLTLYTALISFYLFLNIAAIGYSMYVVKSFYEALNSALDSDSDSDDEESSEEDI